MVTAHVVLGRHGEALVARWYRRRGYRVVARNWRSDGGELDLVLVRGRQIVFCEVKARTDRRYGVPAEAVDAVKQRRVRRVAEAFLQAHDLSGIPYRFDVAEVLAGRVRVRMSAF